MNEFANNLWPGNHFTYNIYPQNFLFFSSMPGIPYEESILSPLFIFAHIYSPCLPLSHFFAHGTLE